MQTVFARELTRFVLILSIYLISVMIICFRNKITNLMNSGSSENENNTILQWVKNR